MTFDAPDLVVVGSHEDVVPLQKYGEHCAKKNNPENRCGYRVGRKHG